MLKRKGTKPASGKAKSAKAGKLSAMKEGNEKLPAVDEILTIDSADVSPLTAVITTQELNKLTQREGESRLPWPKGLVIPKEEDPFLIEDHVWVATIIVYELSEFLQKFNVSRNTAKMWMRERWLGYSTPGGMTYILKSDMLAMLKRFYNPPLLWIGCIPPFLENWELMSAL